MTKLMKADQEDELEQDDCEFCGLPLGDCACDWSALIEPNDDQDPYEPNC